MNFFSVFFFLPLILLSHDREAKAAQVGNDEIYIVYTGAASQKSTRDPILRSLARRRKNPIIHRYDNAFSGFAARLSEEEAQSIAGKPGVVSVFRDPILQLHTTRSWDFLYQTDLQMGLSPRSNSSSPGVDTIIGILDTGIWPESEAFDDKDMGPVPLRWKGTCMTGYAFEPSNCNRKLIGARYYAHPESSRITDRSPRDQNGHGTHIAAIAAGTPVQRASFNGLAPGTAKGGSPGSRIAVYRVCDEFGCAGSNILKAFDDAIADGVDVLSVSLGSKLFDYTDYLTDPVAIGAFHAMEKGVLVVCSAGNGGAEQRSSVVNTAPWIFTVAATTIDRDFETNVLFGGNKVIKGGAIDVARLQKSPVYPMIYGRSAMKNNSTSEIDAYNCVEDQLDASKVKRKIVVCEDADRAKGKLQGILRLGGLGMILINGDEKELPSIYDSPMTAISWEDGEKIVSYLNSTRNPTGTILPTITAPPHKAVPSVPLFSGEGPTFQVTNILKPDIAAPGVGILAAWPGNNTGKGKTSHFRISTGTSVSCPHVTAIAAIVKSQNPTWSPSAIKSAIMTTAIQTNNMKEPIQDHLGYKATPYDIGAGQLSASGPLQPGLVYDMEHSDYLKFLCYKGHNLSTIKLVSSSVPDTFACPSNSNINLASNINYPSISIWIAHLINETSVTVTRTVTNVGADESVYQAVLDIPEGLRVRVTPKTLRFTKGKKKLSYVLSVKLTAKSTAGDLFGSITWANGKYKVRSPLVIQ